MQIKLLVNESSWLLQSVCNKSSHTSISTYTKTKQNVEFTLKISNRTLIFAGGLLWMSRGTLCKRENKNVCGPPKYLYQSAPDMQFMLKTKKFTGPGPGSF